MIFAAEVTNVGTDRAQLAQTTEQAKVTPERRALDVIADRGCFSSEEILKCEQSGTHCYRRALMLIKVFPEIRIEPTEKIANA